MSSKIQRLTFSQTVPFLTSISQNCPMGIHSTVLHTTLISGNALDPQQQFPLIQLKDTGSQSQTQLMNTCRSTCLPHPYTSEPRHLQHTLEPLSSFSGLTQL